MNQSVFAAALLQPELPCPPGLRTWNGSDASVRFGVYRNNVVVSLVDALCSSFPVTQALVGEEFFRAMARLFLQDHPPHTKCLALFGTALPGFIQSFVPAASLPYLTDVATLEIMQVRAFHAADMPPVASHALQGALADLQQLAQLRLRLHPSLHILPSAFAVVSLWAAHQPPSEDGPKLQTLDPNLSECALVCRVGLQVDILVIPPSTGAFVQALQGGRSLLEAANCEPELDLSTALALLINRQLVVGLYAPEKTDL